MDESERRRVVAEEHLRLLRIGYLIEGWLALAFAFFPLIYVAMGVLMASGAMGHGAHGPSSGPPRESLWLGVGFAAFGGLISLFMVTAGGLRLLAARSLRERKSRTLCHVAAALSCLSMPYGTVLGIFTFTVLGRPEVIALFEPQPAEPTRAFPG